jgi:hypothetical protein
MKPYLHAFLPRATLSLIAGTVAVCEVTWAQSQEKPAEATKTQTASGPQKPARDSGWVITDDGVALLSVQKTPIVITASVEDSAIVTTPREQEVLPAAQRKTEIAALEKQIQDKQKRIALLMRLFVDDEREFLNDPGNKQTEQSVQDRRKYEQDELLYESAEIAKMRTRLEQMKAAEKQLVVTVQP